MTNKKGFTIVELMLAMAFLATMLVGIASLVMRITSIYQKGLAIRSVNANGREIVSDLTRTISASRVTVSINPEVPSDGKIEQTHIDEARADYYVSTATSAAKGNRQMGGVFCTGDYSYIWNTADNLRIVRGTNDRLKNKIYTDIDINTILDKGVYVIKVGNPAQYIIPKFARFEDKDRKACVHEEKTIDGVKKYVPAVDPKGTVGGIKPKKAYLFELGTTLTTDAVTELIEDNESDLAMYNFTIFPATQHLTTKQIFYSGMFIIATYRGGVNIKSNGEFCEGSDSETGVSDIVNGATDITLNDFDYCAVNKFNFSARATGEISINKYGE